MIKMKAVERKFKYILAFKVYVYEIDGLLIDTGSASTFEQFKPFFEQLKVEQVVLTHIHEDHSGNAHWWWKEKQRPIYLHSSVLNDAEEYGKYSFYRKLFWGPRLPFQAKPISDIITTNNHQFNVIETPGHSNDSISLYEKNQGWLFTGDLYLTPKPKLFFIEDSIPKAITSLKKLNKLDFEYIFCAHSGKLGNGKKRLQEKLDYLVELQSDVLALHQKDFTKKEIIKKLFPGPKPIIYLSRHEFSYDRAVDSIINND